MSERRKLSVRLAPRVENDLAEIVLSIAADNPVRALSFADELIAKCHTLNEFPKSHAARPEYGAGVRVAIHRPYVIFFRILPHEIRVERILHGARDLPRALDE